MSDDPRWNDDPCHPGDVSRDLSRSRRAGSDSHEREQVAPARRILGARRPTTVGIAAELGGAPPMRDEGNVSHQKMAIRI